MNTDYTFLAWASGNKRSPYRRTTLTIQPRGVDDKILLRYARCWGWVAEDGAESELLKRISNYAELSKFCNALFKYLIKEDYYGTKIKWESDGTLRDVSIY